MSVATDDGVELVAPWVLATCEHFDLGPPQRWWPVEGSRSNELVRVVTSLGLFSCKRMVAKTSTPAFESHLVEACRIERHAHEAGVAMPEPVPDRDSGLALAHVAGGLVRVHRWLDGERLAPAQASADDARAAGRLLASVHAAGRGTGIGAEAPNRFGDQYWTSIVELAARAGSPLAADLAADHASVVRLDDALSHPVPPQWSCVESHRALDADSVLRRVDGSLVAIDWDGAGPVCTHQDTVAMALRWGRPGLDATELVYARVKAFAAGYLQQGGELPRTTDASLPAVWIHDLLGRLAFDVQQSASGHDAERAEHDARQCLRAARDAVWALPDLVGLLVRP